MTEQNPEVHILNYGGGVNSTALAIEMIRREMPFMAVFADTGEEWPETIAYVHRFTAFLRERGHDVHIVQSKHGPMYAYMYNRGWIPNTAFRSCTTEWKRRPVRRWIVESWPKYHNHQYIGIDAGEAHRVYESEYKDTTLHYPLVDWDIDRDDCAEIITAAGLPVPRKSGCWFCPFQRMDQWAALAETQPDLFRKAVALEDNTNGMTLRSDGSLRNLLKRIQAGDRQEHLFEIPCGCYDGILEYDEVVCDVCDGSGKSGIGFCEKCDGQGRLPKKYF